MVSWEIARSTARCLKWAGKVGWAKASYEIQRAIDPWKTIASTIKAEEQWNGMNLRWIKEKNDLKKQLLKEQKSLLEEEIENFYWMGREEIEVRE